MSTICTSSRKNAWTVLAFLNGKNNLSRETRANLKEMRANIPNGVTFVCQAGFLRKKKGVERGEVERIVLSPSSRLEKHFPMPGCTSMGTAHNLVKFMKWGIKNFPARHYLLIVGNHGEGFVGVSCDDLSKKMFSIPSLQKGLKEVKKDTGVAPDIIFFDACHMGQAEVLAQLNGTAKFAVATEEEIEAMGCPWKEILKVFKTARGKSSEEISREIVESIGKDEARRKKARLKESVYQMAALRMDRGKKILEAMDTLASAFLSSSIPGGAIVKVIQATRRFDNGGKKRPYRDFRDGKDFAEKIIRSKKIKNEAVKSAARKFKLQIERTVIANHQGKRMKRAHGVSIYLPTKYGKYKAHSLVPGKPLVDLKEKYRKLDAGKSNWDPFLCKVSRSRTGSHKLH